MHFLICCRPGRRSRKSYKEGDDNMGTNVADVMLNLIESMASNSACMFLWGETEMPACLKDKIQNEDQGE